MIILVTIVIVALIVLLFTAFYLADYVEKKNTYVYKGNKYFYKGKCLMKDTSSRKWITGIMYMSLRTGELFVREENDFLVKFITYKEWKNGGNVKSSRSNRREIQSDACISCSIQRDC